MSMNTSLPWQTKVKIALAKIERKFLPCMLKQCVMAIKVNLPCQMNEKLAWKTKTNNAMSMNTNLPAKTKF